MIVDKTNREIIFGGANVYIQNGAGGTPFPNGYGNLVVGYDTPPLNAVVRSGSHNLVVGDAHEDTGIPGSYVP